jgi:hypothetical protein
VRSANLIACAAARSGGSRSESITRWNHIRHQIQ